jgi:hypothetical protein
MLWIVIAMTRSTVLGRRVFGPSAISTGKPRWRCGTIRSRSQRKSQPAINPIAAGNQGIPPISSVIAMAGMRRDQILVSDHHPGRKPETPVQETLADTPGKEDHRCPERRHTPGEAACNERLEHRSSERKYAIIHGSPHRARNASRSSQDSTDDGL